jgi:hypothetical protein
MRNSWAMGAAALAAMLSAGCLFGGGSESDPDTGASQATGTYRISGDTLFISRFWTGYRCDDSTGLGVLDTMYDEYARLPAISGKERVDWHPSAYAVGHPDSANFDSLGAIQNGELYVRVGGGSGLKGLWKGTNRRIFRVVAGNLDSAVLAPHRWTEEQHEWLAAHIIEHEEFSDSTIRFSVSFRSADMFLSLWNGTSPDADPATADSAYYDIKLSKVDRHTLRYKGLRTGEVVTREVGDDGSTRFTSTLAAHPAHVYDRKAPPDCGNLLTDNPAWWSDFLRAQARYPEEELGKRGVRPGVKFPGP